MNKLRRDRQQVRDAAVRVIDARRQLQQQTSSLRERFDRYRPAILVGGGFLAGLVLGRKQFVHAARSAFTIASLGVGVARSALGSMLLATTLHKGSATARNARPATRTDQG